MAQLAEQLTCNQQVFGSSPNIGFLLPRIGSGHLGRIPKWPKGADCKSVIDDFEGSNPSSPIINIFIIGAEWSSSVARRAHNP